MMRLISALIVFAAAGCSKAPPPSSATPPELARLAVNTTTVIRGPAAFNPSTFYDWDVLGGVYVNYDASALPAGTAKIPIHFPGSGGFDALYTGGDILVGVPSEHRVTPFVYSILALDSLNRVLGVWTSNTD